MGDLLLIDGVGKGYSRGSVWVPVLADVSLEVLPGEIVAILGARLSGKTTLLKIAAGIEKPDRGGVFIEAHGLGEIPDRMRSVRWIDRDGPGLDIDVRKYVGWPLAMQGRRRRQAERSAGQMLEKVGAYDCADRRWGDLSNWQRVLVGLARGFVGNPKLVIVDDLLDALGEPATEEASDLLQSLLAGSHPGPSVLMSVSDAASAMFADRVVGITGKGSLRSMSGRLTDKGEVVPIRPRRVDRT